MAGLRVGRWARVVHFARVAAAGSAVLLSVGSAVAGAHPIHTTLTVLSHDVARGTIDVSIRAFADDFSAAVARAAGKPAPRDSAVSADDVTRYVQARLTIDGVRLEPCGVQRTVDAYLLCFRARVPLGVTTLRARNLLLTEVHRDQVNIVQVQGASARRTHVFTASSKLMVLGAR